jgi:hypothetical protein
MNFPSPSRRPARLRFVAAALAACAAALLGGCSAAMVGDNMPAAVGGLPADAPARSLTPAAYPAVHNMPPARSAATLNNDQQKQLEDDLVAARNRYGGNPDAAEDAATTASTGTSANAKAGSAGNP